MHPSQGSRYATKDPLFANGASMVFSASTRSAESVVVFAGFLAAIVLLQVLSDAYSSAFGGYPDEPAHLVTSLMARDFLAGANLHTLTHPFEFVRDYYYHYPKVSIGHWPPLFYGLAGVWFLVFGASRATALLFIAATAALTATLIYFTGKRLIGIWAGILAAALFVASPLVQESSVRFMSEHLSTLASLASALSFARLARSGRVIDGLLFGVAATLAILTHPNAWALALLPPLVIALTNRWWLLRRSGLWASVLPPLLIAVPWYVATLAMLEDGVGGGEPFWVQGAKFGWDIYAAVGIVVLVLAAIGVYTALIARHRAAVAPEWAAIAALAIALFALHSVIPTGAENRYMVPVIPCVALFAIAGVDYAAGRFARNVSYVIARVGVAAVVLAAFALQSFALPLQLRNGGYGAMVAEVTNKLSNVPQVWLVSASSTGEGSLVAAVALQENQRASYVLRARTLLAGGDWLWNNTEDRFDTPAKLAGLLDEIPVTIVVVDDLVPAVEKRPYQDRLKTLVAGEPGRWALIGSYPQVDGGVAYPNSLHVYARQPLADRRLAAPAVDLPRVKQLMVRKELQ
jgi:Dolichyl-phosphate-mannose-protein mannosyltransferase